VRPPSLSQIASADANATRSHCDQRPLACRRATSGCSPGRRPRRSTDRRATRPQPGVVGREVRGRQTARRLASVRAASSTGVGLPCGLVRASAVRVKPGVAAAADSPRHRPRSAVPDASVPATARVGREDALALVCLHGAHRPSSSRIRSRSSRRTRPRPRARSATPPRSPPREPPRAAADSWSRSRERRRAPCPEAGCHHRRKARRPRSSRRAVERREALRQGSSTKNGSP
jgi:hypothetical protein